jgi:hypothetical protein
MLRLSLVAFLTVDCVGGVHYRPDGVVVPDGATGASDGSASVRTTDVLFAYRRLKTRRPVARIMRDGARSVSLPARHSEF